MVKGDHEHLDRATYWLELLRRADRVAGHLPPEMRVQIEDRADPLELERLVDAWACISAATRREVEATLVWLLNVAREHVTPTES